MSTNVPVFGAKRKRLRSVLPSVAEAPENRDVSGRRKRNRNRRMRSDVHPRSRVSFDSKMLRERTVRIFLHASEECYRVHPPANPIGTIISKRTRRKRLRTPMHIGRKIRIETMQPKRFSLLVRRSNRKKNPRIHGTCR